nr:S41 family peptidase [Desulfobacterales bacterium]
MIKKREHNLALCLFFLLFVSLCVFYSGFHKRLIAGTEKTYEELKIFSDVLDIIEKNYVDPVDSKTLIRGAIKGMINVLDPHSSYLLPEAFKELQIDTRGRFTGVGIVITMQNNVVTVISPIEGTPAYKAGIRAGDIIVKVDGVETKGMMLWEVVKKIRGKKGTTVILTISREGLDKPRDFAIVRDVIPLESVRWLELEPGFGYIRITTFRDDTDKEVEAALRKLESGREPMHGLILDLRDNPGGLLEQAVNVSDIFLEEGRIVSIMGRVKTHNKVFMAHPNRIKHNYPMVVLINGGSASASEIVAGALQDHGRALILGTTSFGKGSVQAIERMRDGSALKLTIARYYTPKGRSIQAEGIKPDIMVEKRWVEEEKKTQTHRLREKDLKNHIAPVPESEPEEGKKDVNEKEMRKFSEPGVPKISKELLKRDNQVQRALQILKGWYIFSGMSF